MVGRTISHYRILSELGAGGMGVVYEAVDNRLGRRVALKFLSEDVIDNQPALERFQREARAASSLNHPNICTIYDIEEYQSRPFIAMELLDGCDLRETIAAGPLPPDMLLNIATQIADALDAAHEANIIHRDITPSNIFLTRRRQAKLMDFGLAKLAREKAMAAGHSSPTVSRVDVLTSPGVAVGTVAYMSPEQARAEELDRRTDLFSFGAVLYEMATGRMAFPGSTAAVVFEGILNRTPPPPSRFNPRLSPDFERTIMKLLEKDRELRYQTAAEVRVDLRRLKRQSAEGVLTPIPEPQPLDEELPSVPRGIVRTLLALIQAMYLVFYVVALNRLEEIRDLGPARFLDLSGLIVPAIFVTALVGTAVRLYMITAVAFDYRALGQKFRRVFPLVLPLDQLWALTPLLAAQTIGIGPALATMVALLYVPFSQRTLVRMAYSWGPSSSAARQKQQAAP